MSSLEIPSDVRFVRINDQFRIEDVEIAPEEREKILTCQEMHRVGETGSRGAAVFASRDRFNWKRCSGCNVEVKHDTYLGGVIYDVGNGLCSK
jgi:hypothetical protein